MASIVPVVVLVGSAECISQLSLQIPVTFKFAFHEASLERLITAHVPLSIICLPKYFVILLQSVDDELLTLLSDHHRVHKIHGQEAFSDASDHCKLHRVVLGHGQQFVLDLTQDIVDFFATAGRKQEVLERLELASIYYRQGRILKEWVMSFMKVETS